MNNPVENRFVHNTNEFNEELIDPLGYSLVTASERDLWQEENDSNIMNDSGEPDEEDELGEDEDNELANENLIEELNVEETSFNSDLDVPGSELDDEDEAIGSEDEENNYYSIGGDNHNDLEEEKEG